MPTTEHPLTVTKIMTFPELAKSNRTFYQTTGTTLNNSNNNIIVVLVFTQR